MRATPDMCVAQVIAAALARGLERLDAQLLLLHAFGKPAHERAWLLAHDTDLLPPATQAMFDAFVQRRAAGEPLAYITGHPGVWLTTSREIAEHYLAHGYDASVADIAARQTTGPGGPARPGGMPKGA